MVQFFDKIENLKISKNLTHSEWIENSDIIIHNGCTAGVEAFARNKKIISFEPTENKSKMHFANQFGHKAKNEIELGDIIEKIYDNDINENKDVKNLNQFIFRFNKYEEENFAKNIYDEWSKLENNHLSKENSLFIIKLINKLRLIKNMFFKPYFNEKFPPLDKKKIDNIFSKLKSIDSSFEKVNLELIGPKLFSLNLIK